MVINLVISNSTLPQIAEWLNQMLLNTQMMTDGNHHART
jgi:hypothetical protein